MKSTAKRAPAKKAAKRKSSPPKPIVVDAKASIPYVMAKLRAEKDPTRKAFWKRELEDLKLKVQSAVEAAERSLFVVIHDTKVRIGDHLFFVKNRHVLDTEPPYVQEVTVKKIVAQPLKPKELTVVGEVNGRSYTETVQDFRFNSFFTTPEAAVDEAIDRARKVVASTQTRLNDETARYNALVALRGTLQPMAETSAPPDAPSPVRKVGKKWSDADNALLRKLQAEGKCAEDMVESLGRSRDAIVRQIVKLDESTNA